MLGLSGPVVPGAGSFSVDATGEVRSEGRLRGQLLLQRVADPESLQTAGNGMFSSRAALLKADRYVVHQGFQERSNAALGADMVKIMEVSRHIESVQRALSAYDSLLNSGINQLGKE